MGLRKGPSYTHLFCTWACIVKTILFESVWSLSLVPTKALPVCGRYLVLGAINDTTMLYRDGQTVGDSSRCRQKSGYEDPVFIFSVRISTRLGLAALIIGYNTKWFILEWTKCWQWLSANRIIMKRPSNIGCSVSERWLDSHNYWLAMLVTCQQLSWHLVHFSPLVTKTDKSRLIGQP